MELLVSIILPVYNGEKYLSKAIDSIIAQTYKNWELIIVDDCSTDSTPLIIHKYTELDSRIKSVVHERNKRLPQALNTGFALAKGEYFTWTSDDNIYYSDAIETMADALYNKKCDIVYCNEDIIDENENVINKTDVIAGIGNPEEIPVLSCVGGCFLFKKEVYFNIGEYDCEKFLVEDWDFWLRAYNKGYKYCRINEIHYKYRDNSGSLTAMHNSEIQRRCLKLSMDNLEKNSTLYTDIIKMRAYLKCAGFAYRIPDKAIGKECFESAVKINPEAASYLKPEILKWVVNDDE